MKHRCLLIVACAALGATGCASVAPQGAWLTGERSIHVTDFRSRAHPEARPAVIPVEHVFELSNSGSKAAVIVSHRTRIDTTWHFADTGDAVLPSTIGPGETVRIAVTGKVRQQGTQRFFVKLQLATGDVVDLELHVDG